MSQYSEKILVFLKEYRVTGIATAKKSSEKLPVIPTKNRGLRLLESIKDFVLVVIL